MLPREAEQPPLHAAFARQAVGYLQQYAGIVAVGAAGSWIYGRTSPHSDLDLTIVCSDEAHAMVMADKMIIAQDLGPLLTAFVADHTAERRLLACLYDKPLLRVDLRFIPLTDAANRVEDAVVLWELDHCYARKMQEKPRHWPAPTVHDNEQRFWYWVLAGLQRVARGELFEAIESLSWLRYLVLGPLALHTDDTFSKGMRRLETERPDLVPAFAATLCHHDHADVLRAYRALIALYCQLRDECNKPEQLVPAAQQAVLNYLNAIF